MHTARGLLCLALVVAGAGASGVALGEVRTFDYPSIDGFRVHFCNRGGDACGRPIAEKWCVDQGYEAVTDWTIDRAVDFSSATIRLDDGAICRGSQCDGFRSITCEREGSRYTMPTLGGLTRTTLISPDLRSSENAVGTIEYTVLIPGCHHRSMGDFLCETVRDYQHCRSLLRDGKVVGCRAGLAFDGGFAEPAAAPAGSYDVRVRSSAEATVYRGRRGEGELDGDVRFEVEFAEPATAPGTVCLQRDRYVYYPTGPEGGLSEIGATDDCDEPVEGSFAPHVDDLLHAFERCRAADAWGSRIEQPIEVMVAGLYHLRSATETRIVAPYVNVEASMRVSCRE